MSPVAEKHMRRAAISVAQGTLTASVVVNHRRSVSQYCQGIACCRIGEGRSKETGFGLQTDRQTTPRGQNDSECNAQIQREV